MGTTTVTGKTTFKADAQLATATVKGLTVSSGIKTPSSNEGSVGTPAQAGSDNLNLLVKLSELEEKIKGINQKAEENKKQEEEAIKKQEK